jgi:hypothetical protein
MSRRLSEQFLESQEACRTIFKSHRRLSLRRNKPFEENYKQDFYIGDFKEADRNNMFTFLPKTAAEK